MAESNQLKDSRRDFLMGAAGAVATAALWPSGAGATPNPGANTSSGTGVPGQEKALHIDIPVTLVDVKTVYSIASLSFEGDLPACIFHLQLIVNDISNPKAQSQVVAVFHTNAGHVILHDQAYNRDRNIATGNPYKKLVTELMDRGVRVELCGATAKAHGWVNEDTIPGIKVNTDAMSRTTQLVQQGFVKISES